MESRAFIVALIVGILATVTMDVGAGVLAVISGRRSQRSDICDAWARTWS
jgi:hypothetical protein